MTDKILIDRSVVEQALEALFMYKPMVTGVTFQHGLGAMQALRAALDQPQVEQEPVAWAEEIIEYLHAHYDTEMIKELDSGDALIRLDDAIAAVEEVEQRYTHPQPPRQPLTDEQMRDALRQCPHDAVENLRVRWLYAKDFARAIERAHGIGGEK